MFTNYNQSKAISHSVPDSKNGYLIISNILG